MKKLNVCDKCFGDAYLQTKYYNNIDQTIKTKKMFSYLLKKIIGV